MSDEDYGNEVEDGDGNFDKSDADAGSTDSNEDGDNCESLLSLFYFLIFENFKLPLQVQRKEFSSKIHSWVVSK